MSYWSGDLMRGTAENPLNAHIDFGGLEVRIKGGASTLFAHKTPQTVIQNLNIIDTNNSTDAKLAPIVNYATTGPCGYAGHTDTANYVYTEQEMKDWFASYSNAANPTKSKCLKVMMPFVTTITTQLSETDYLQSKHYDFGGATIIHNLKYLLPRTEGTTPTISNLIVRLSGSSLQAGIIHELRGGTVENCTIIAYGTLTINNGRFGGITSLTYPAAIVKNCKFSVQNAATTNFSGTQQGGIVGYNHGTIENCRAEFLSGAVVHANAQQWGGIVGFMSQSARLRNSSAAVDIDSYASNNQSTGGLIGEIGNGGQANYTIVEDCYSEGYEISGYRNVGGAIGAVHCTSGRSPSIIRTKSFVTRVTTKYNYSSGSQPICLGGFLGYTSGGYSTSGFDLEDCISFTEPYTDGGDRRADAPYSYQGGFVGKSGTGITNYNNCGVYISQISYGSNGKTVVCGGFAGEFESGTNGKVSINNPKIYVRNWVNKGGLGGGYFGTLFGACHSYPTLTNNSSTIVYRTQPTVWMDGYDSAAYSDRPTTTTWQYSQPFGSAGVKPSINTLSGSSVTQVSTPISGKQIKFKFTGLSDYYLDNIYISVGAHTTAVNVGGYTQIMYNGTLLSDFSAKSMVGTVPKAHSRGDSNILAQDEFYFYYKSPNTSNNEVAVKIQLKHKTTSAKRTFMLFGSSQWFEI